MQSLKLCAIYAVVALLAATNAKAEGSQETESIAAFSENVVMEIRLSECRGILDRFRTYESARFAIVNNRSYQIRENINATQLHRVYDQYPSHLPFNARFGQVISGLGLEIDGKTGPIEVMESSREKFLKRLSRANCSAQFVDGDGSVCSCNAN